jgi:hypothetical protein
MLPVGPLWLRVVRNLPVTGFSSGRVWRRRDAPPCCCAPKKNAAKKNLLADGLPNKYSSPVSVAMAAGG